MWKNEEEIVVGRGRADITSEWCGKTEGGDWQAQV